MTTITLELPDELATRLVPLREQLPTLLSLVVELFPAERIILPGVRPLHPALEEVIGFLAAGPTPAQIAEFKVSSATQARLEELLDKNRENDLTEGEVAELEMYEQINHILLLLKARARAIPFAH
jgi:hypothetical protein